MLSAFAALAALGAVASGCESTQDTSARLAKELGPVQRERGLAIRRESKDVAVVSKTLLSDVNGTAVVIELRNETQKTLRNIPILIDVRNASGKSIFKNDLPGLETGLVSMPLLGPGETAAWVHDQVLAVGKPASVAVKIGAGAEVGDVELPDLEVSGSRLEGDPVSGLASVGEVINRTGEKQGRLLLYAVARKGGRIIAAGRGAIERFKAETKPVVYRIFYIGNPRGAQVDLTSFPTIETP